MTRLTGLLAAAAVGLTAGSVSAQTPGVRPAVFTPVLQTQLARLSLGSIQGLVSDERGGPLAGALVSALGLTPRWPRPTRAAASSSSRSRPATTRCASAFPGSSPPDVTASASVRRRSRSRRS